MPKSKIKLYTSYQITVIIFLFLVFYHSFAQFNTFLKPAKIGLVLSGGGARGFAHIGVLKLIDSLGIKIDYITGTSMGAVVGGLYAAGYSAREIDSLARVTDWPIIFADYPPREKLAFFEKKELNRFQLPFVIRDFKLEPPSGLIAGQKVSLLLSRLFVPVCQITDFDSLPLPFYCIAADLITGNEVVLDKGSLSKAIRASMSVPSVFTPVEWGDSLLVDGGILNKLPVDVAQRMGADYIIAVNVGEPMKSREELTDALSILLQSFLLAGFQREEKNIKNADLVITPDLDGYSSTDFVSGKIKAMISIGENTANLYSAELAALTHGRQVKNENLSEKFLHGALIHGIRITGNEKLSFSFIYSLLGVTPGMPLDINYLERRIDHIYGLGYFQTFSYRIEHFEKNKYILHLEVEERVQKLLRLGMRYQDDKKVIAAVNFKLNDFPFAGIRNDLTYLFSGLQLLEWEVSYPWRILGNQLYPYFYTFYRDIPVVLFDNRDKIARYHKRGFGSEGGIGFVFSNFGMIKGGYNLERLNVSPSIAFSGEIIWPEWKFTLHTGRVYTEVDLLDDILYPKHGYRLQMNYEHTLDFIKQHDQFSRIYLKQTFYGTVFSRNTTGLHLTLGFGDDVPLYRYFFCGGPDEFTGMNYDEFNGQNIGIYRLDNRFRFSRLLSVIGIFNAGNRWEDYSKISLKENFVTGFGIGIQLRTIAGPFRYIIGYREGETMHYFTLGFSLVTRNDEKM